MVSIKQLTICLFVTYCYITCCTAALLNFDQNFLILSYDNFDNSSDVCTSDDNWCDNAENHTGAILYGYLTKMIKIPENADKLEINILLSSTGWGEGLAVDIDEWTPSSAVRIMVDDDVREIKIPKLASEQVHHNSYYKFEYGETIFSEFNVTGKSSALLTIEMVDGARMDIDATILIFKSNKIDNLTRNSTENLHGICYGPFRENENPNLSIYPTQDEIKEDLIFLKNITNTIRTYSVNGSLIEVPLICQDEGVDCYVGAWISENKENNDEELQRLIQVANQNVSSIKGLIVGNEVLLRQDVSEEELISYINLVRGQTSLPITTADVWSIWSTHPKLVNNVDFILAHVHPYWEGVKIADASSYVEGKWFYIRAKYPDKTIIIGETGWPSEGEHVGEAVPSQDAQRKFILDFLNMASYYNIPYFYFEAFDEKWKIQSEACAGANWGIYYSNGSIKQELSEGALKEPACDFKRTQRTISATVPWIIYTESDQPVNKFFPTGWMGDLKDFSGNPNDVLNVSCTENPKSQKYCIKIDYTRGSKGWGGIYWQYPENNWGDHPGYNISGANKLTFWAKGEMGGEKAKFIVGGINSSGKPYRDSFESSTGVIGLTTDWRKYTIDLKNNNLTDVIGGFCWVADRGSTIYLDDIQFE